MKSLRRMEIEAWLAVIGIGLIALIVGVALML
jgi:hypothetical protein